MSTIDLVPTLLNALSLPKSAVLPGVDLLSPAVAERQSIFGECFTHNAVDLNHPAAGLRWRWIISGSWKLIVPAPRNEANATAELYALDHDPHEQHNLASRHADVVRTLTAQLDNWWNGQ